MDKKELAEAKAMVRKVKAEVILRGMPYARVRDLDTALTVIDQVLLNREDGE